MRPGPDAVVRIARPSRDLAAAQRFWVDGLSLDVLFEAGPDAEGGHRLLMVGWPAGRWHLELVEDPELLTERPPSAEDLLVLYLGGPIDDDVLPALTAAGGEQVAARNPYWDRWGITVRDPDGYLLVLSHRSWE